MKKIILKINNKKIETTAGKTLLAVAKSNNIYIPTLCSHPSLPNSEFETPKIKIYQNGKKINNTQKEKNPNKCGLCLIEININNEKTIINACTSKAKNGMVIITDNGKIKKERQKNLKVILSQHKHSCLTCAQKEGCSQTQCSTNVPEIERCCSNFNNCELKKISEYIGIPNDTPKWVGINSNMINDQPLLEINYDLCIGCTRCVRMCNTIRGVNALGFVWDIKDKIKVGTIHENHIKSGCKFCMSCVEVCPTGALKDKFIEKNKKNIIPCIENCPIHINIPEFIRTISLGDFETANLIIKEKLPFPRILGRICIHPCEKACRRNEINSPISICSLKKFVSDFNQNKNPYKKIKLESGKKISIIGAGPTGLTAGFYLRRKGHFVTIYDENNKPGGMLRYGIPKYRLPDYIIEKEINDILATGIKFKPNKKFGRDFNINDLKNKKQDIIIISTGAQIDKKLHIEGQNLDGVYGGIEFLKNFFNKNIKKNIPKSLIVIGGGNVAIDVAMTSVRYGIKKTTIVCLENEDSMPANSWEIKTAKDEGIKILESLMPKKILGKDNKVIGLKTSKCISVFDKNGIFNPKCDDKINKIITTEIIVIAIGQKININDIRNNNIKIKNNLIFINNKTFETSLNNVYAGGDVTKLPGSVINSISFGRKLAEKIDFKLGGTGIIDEAFVKKTTPNPYIKRDENFIYKKKKMEKELTPYQRNKNFKEIMLGLTKEEAISEANRCLQCDLKLNIEKNSTPPNNLISLNIKNIDKNLKKEIEGVYKTFDINKKIISIAGTKNLRNDLIFQTKNKDVIYFEFEIEKMYSKRESELIQKYIQEHGKMPTGNENLDDLF